MPRDESLTATGHVNTSAVTPSSRADERVVHDLDLAGGEELLTVRDAARFLNVSVSWVYEHVRPGNENSVPVVKLGKYLRFDRRDLRAYVDAKRAASRRHPRRH